MGLLFPAIGIIKEQARKVQAKNDVTNIVAAVKQYYTEYGKYPARVGSAGDRRYGRHRRRPRCQPDRGATTTPSSTPCASIPEGLNANYKFNPRRIVFFEGKGASRCGAPRAVSPTKRPTPRCREIFTIRGASNTTS